MDTAIAGRVRLCSRTNRLGVIVGAEENDDAETVRRSRCEGERDGERVEVSEKQDRFGDDTADSNVSKIEEEGVW